MKPLAGYSLAGLLESNQYYSALQFVEILQPDNIKDNRRG
jgi:hypothetical protein